MIPYGKHTIDEEDISSVVEVLQHRFLTQGEKAPQFEKALCQYTGSEFCTVVNSGTSGLHIACLALGIGPDDWVWTSPNSFAASANCAIYCGANIDFVDIDPVTFNLCVKKLEYKLEEAKNKNILPKALIVVHFAGCISDMEVIKKLADEYGVFVIEDAAHALGAEYINEKVGSCQFSDLAVFSFHPVKSITSAEGGAVTTNKKELNTKLQLFGKHGITRDPELMLSDSDGPWYYQQVELGYNYRMSDLQAALGISQLSKLDDFIIKRRALASRYFSALKPLPVQLPREYMLDKQSWHLFMLVLKNHDRASVYQELHSAGIAANVHYIPIHIHPFYQKLGFRKGDFPNSEHFYENAITLPLYPSLSLEEQDHVIETLKTLLG